MSTKSIPNLLSAARIVLALSLLFVKPFSAAFFLIYSAAGVSDIFDGFLARRLHAQSRFGSRLDSAGDFVMAAVCLIRLLPLLNFEHWVFYSAAAVFVIKIANVLFALKIYRRAFFLHTAANKLTGLLLFLSPFVLNFVPSGYIAGFLLSLAAFAAIQEGHFIRTGKIEKE